MAIVENLEKMLEAGKDNALLRFSLGQEYLKRKNYERAILHLKTAVQHDPLYSAAWKRLGVALEESGDLAQALQSYQEGVKAAAHQGDKQALKEMEVFMRRITKKLG